MASFPNDHFSAIVTDPPYGLGFMGKKWDAGLPHSSIWTEALRVCKPGAFLLAFGGTRTYHRLTCAIEDAGWEIRDCIMWLYGSGFPKGKGCLKPAYEPIVLARKKAPRPELNMDGCRIGTDDTRSEASKNALGLMNDDGWECKPMIVGSSCGRWPANLILDEEAGAMLDEQGGIGKSSVGIKKRNIPTPNVYGKYGSLPDAVSGYSDSGGPSRFFYCPKASSRERNEGIDCYITVKHDIDQKDDLCLEENTAAVQLLQKIASEQGLESFSIDVFGEGITVQFHKDFSSIIRMKIRQIIESKTSNSSTLSPTNEFIRDVVSWMENGLNHAVNVQSKNLFQSLITKGEMVSALGVSNVVLKMLSLISEEGNWKEKKSTHPTVKPLALMQYLIKLVMPPESGILLDPFAGSGSTLVAAKRLGFEFVGIEKESEYVTIANARLSAQNVFVK